LKFQTEYKKIRKLRINKENLNDEVPEDKKIKTERPWKQFSFENISDNFYLNILDLDDSGKMAIGRKSGVSIYDVNKHQKDQNFEIYNYDSNYEIFCVKLM
jgi:hypothetical protein